VNKSYGTPLIWAIQIGLALCSIIGTWYYGLQVASHGLASIGRPILYCADLVPAWYGSREILFRRGDPYSPKVTDSIQTAIYGAEVGAGIDQQRFAYPAFFAFLFLPFAALPFAAAEKLALVCFAALTAASVFWWAGKPTIHYWILATLLIAASFPFFYALYGRQPTLLIAGILAASFAAARSGRLTLCGFLLAVATSKPQLALPVALPIGAWALNEVRHRKAVILSFVGSGCILMIGSQFYSPNWLTRWIGVLCAYENYVAAKPLSTSLAGVRMGALLSALLLCSVAYVTWRCREDLPFTVAYCIAAFSLLIPFHIYDEVLLLAPITWLASNRKQFESWVGHLLLTAVVASLCMGWFSTTATSLLYLVSHRAALFVWEFPLGLTGILPFSIYVALCHYAFSRRCLGCAGLTI
jgi:Glycosyltransferase family 87